jgi:Ca2+-transporting ATPase
VLESCETMANASLICTDKTGSTLTQSGMTVVAGSIDIHARLARKLDENPAGLGAGNEDAIRTNAMDLPLICCTLTPSAQSHPFRV